MTPALPTQRRGWGLAALPLLSLSFVLSACSGTPPERFDPIQDGLPSCESAARNCVHTGDRHPEGTEPLRLSEAWMDESPGALLSRLEEALLSLPRTEVVTVELEPGALYLRAESVSRTLRFVDDVEFLWRVGSPELELRSASRVGRGDRGVNLERVEALREALREGGVVQ